MTSFFQFTDRKCYILISQQSYTLVFADYNTPFLILAVNPLKISQPFLIINKQICANQNVDELDGNCKNYVHSTLHLTHVSFLKASKADECEFKGRLCSITVALISHFWICCFICNVQILHLETCLILKLINA